MALALTENREVKQSPLRKNIVKYLVTLGLLASPYSAIAKTVESQHQSCAEIFEIYKGKNPAEMSKVQLEQYAFCNDLEYQNRRKILNYWMETVTEEESLVIHSDDHFSQWMKNVAKQDSSTKIGSCPATKNSQVVANTQTVN